MVILLSLVFFSFFFFLFSFETLTKRAGLSVGPCLAAVPLRSVGLALLAGVLVSCCFPVLLFGVCVGCWLCCGSACCCCTVVWGPCCVSFLLCPVFVDFGGWSHFRVPLVHVMSC